MILYFVRLATYKEEVREYALQNIPDARTMESYAYITKKLLNDIVENRNFKHIFLDCGAYTVMTQGQVIKLEDYIEFCQELPSEVEAIASLDVIGDGDATKHNWDVMRKEISGVIPTYHYGEDPKLLEYYVKNTDYVALGGVANNVQTINIPHFQHIFHCYPNHKFHAFGINSIPLLKTFPFYSADASTWMSGGRYGRILTPQGMFYVGREYKKMRSYDVHLREQLKEITGLDFDAKDFSYYDVDKYNLMFLYQTLVLEHTPIDFLDQPLTQTLF